MNTPGQTIGPFFGYALPFAGGPDLVAQSHPDAIRLHGYVLDGAGEPVPDALIELWQPTADGTVPAQSGSLQPRRLDVHRLGTCRHRRDRPLGLHHDRPRGTVLRADGLRPRPARPAVHPRLPARAPGTGNRPAARRAANGAARHHDRGRADEHGHRFDIRFQGPDETVFLDYRR